MSRLVFREARPEDDAQLTRLIALPMPGNLSLSFTREPSYLQACAHCGPPRRVLTALEGDKVVALTSFFLREYWWDGQPRQVWTLSDFRALPQRAGYGITGQGWKALRELLENQPAMLSVVEDNTRALALFSKPRPGWPSLYPIAELRTNLTPLLPFPSWPSQRYHTRRLSPEEILNVLSRDPQPLQPLIEAKDFGTTIARDFWGVFQGEQILGFAGLHDQSRYRQVRIHSYAGWYKRLHRLGRALHLPLLPEPGREIPIRIASLLHCPNPSAWRALRAALCQEARRQKAAFLVWCRAGPNPTNLSFAYRSRLYQILWEGEKPLPALAKSGSDPLSFEVAWL